MQSQLRWNSQTGSKILMLEKNLRIRIVRFISISLVRDSGYSYGCE